MSLTFDADRMFKDLVDECLIPSADEAMKRVRKMITGGFTDGSKICQKAKQDVKQIDAFLNKTQTEIVGQCVSYGWAILKSFGSGNEMDLGKIEGYEYNELSEYIGGKLWNPLRSGTQIVGRKAGNYQGLLGYATSKGEKEGKKIGGGIKPNYVIQNAEKMLNEKGFVDRIIERKVEKFFETHPFDSYFDDGE